MPVLQKRHQQAEGSKCQIQVPTTLVFHRAE